MNSNGYKAMEENKRNAEKSGTTTTDTLLRPVSDNEIINPSGSLSINDAISNHDPVKVYYTLYKAALNRARLTV